MLSYLQCWNFEGMGPPSRLCGSKQGKAFGRQCPATSTFCQNMGDGRQLYKNGSLVQGNLVHIQEAVPSREDFLLPTLGPKLEKLGEEVRIGRGFQLLRCVDDTSTARSLNT